MGQFWFVSCGFLKEVLKEEAELWDSYQGDIIFYDVNTLLLQLKDTFANRERLGFDLHPLQAYCQKN